jgi:ribose transport system substrate-binding protein
MEWEEVLKVTSTIAAALCLSAIGLTAAARADQPVLAFIITNAQNPAEVSMIEGFKRKGKELGADVRIVNASGSVEKMGNAVDDMIALNVKGIATITMDSVVAKSWVDKANAAKIPYVSVAVQVGDPTTTPFKQVYPGLSALVGQDYIVTGSRMAEAVVPLLPKGRKAKIGIVEGQPGYALVAQLNQGFSAKLKEAGVDFNIVFSQPTDWTPAKGEQVCANGLVANPDIDVIFSHAEDMAIGCAKAIADAGSKAKLVTVAGGSKLGTPLIKSGAIAISMCEAWIRTGELGAQALYDAATKPDTPKARLIEYLPELITAKNTDSVCPPQW